MINFPKGIEPERLELFRVNPLDHTGLVCGLAEKYMGRGVEFDDLVAYGIVGLLKACQRYDKKRGAKFSTYGRYWIDQEIRRSFRVDQSFIQVPEYLYARRNKVDRGDIELEPKSQEKLDAARKIWKTPVLRITQSGEEGAPSCCESNIPDRSNSDNTEFAEETEDYSFLRKALTDLEVGEQRLMIMLYFQGKLIKQVMEVTGLTYESVCKMRDTALQKLRDSLGVVEI